MAALTVVASAQLSLTPTNVPVGQVGVPYPPVTLTADGGVPPYTLALDGASDPRNGITFDGSTASLSGTPTFGGPANFQIWVTDHAGTNKGFVVHMDVIDIQPATLPDATIGALYQQPLSGIGFVPPINPVNLSLVSGSPPPGISLVQSPGNLFVLTGTPSAPGSYSFSVQADNGSLSFIRALTLMVSPPVKTIHVANGNVPNATLGQPYSFAITTIDGTPPLTVTMTGGTLTPGITLSPSGLLSGTPTATGSYGFGIEIVDSVGAIGTWNYQLNTYPPPLTVSPATIPGGTVGQDYSVTFSASEGIPPYRYNLSLAFISGLALDSNTGVLSGKPSVSGTFTIRIDAQDSASATGSRTYTLTIAGNNNLLLSPLSLPGGTIGQTYGESVFGEAPLGSSLTPPLHWALSNGSLPPGLSLNTSLPDRVTIQGSPTTAGTFPFHLTGSDSGSLTSGWDYSITIVAPAISVGPDTLPPGTVSVPYAVNFTASGGTPPYTFALFNGASSIGVTPLSLSSNGAFQYTSIVAGYANFTIQATDSAGAKGARDYQLTIAAATLSITPVQLPSGTIHQPYAATLIASGGTAPYTFSAVGTLPNGISLSTAGSLSGTPQQSGNFNVSVTVTDSVGAAASHGYQLVIAGDPITLGPASLPDALGNQPYSAQLTASGGTAPYTFTMPSATNWAAGMVVNPDGTITGTPPAGTTTLLSFTVQATDANGSTGVHIFQINLRSGQATLTFAPASLPSAVASRAYSATITASGGQAPYTFSITGTLPAGLTLSSAGILAGTPTVPGTFGIQVHATDANGVAGTADYVLTVGSSPPGTNTLTVDPGSLSFSAHNTDAVSPAPQSVSVFSSGGPASFSVLSSGGSWLTASPASGQTPGSFLVSINKTGLSSGTTYNGQVTISAQDATPATINIPVTLTMVADTSPVLGVSPSRFQLSFVQGSPPDHQQLVISNQGTGALSVSFQTQTASCGNWLAPANGGDSVTAGVPLVLDLTLDPRGLPPGTCAGQIVVTGAAGQIQTVPITMVISGQSQSLLLSQTGLDFQVAPGSLPATQTFGIVNTGTGSMNWSIPSSGMGWLKVNPAGGVAVGGALAASLVSVTVDPLGLASGQYYGTVEVDAPDAGNSPKSVTVSLRVLDPGKSPAPDATPSGLILVGQTAQSVTLANHSNAVLTYSSTVVTEDGQPWLTGIPAGGDVPADGTVQVNVQANLAGSTPGLWRGTVKIAFSDGTLVKVTVVLVVTGAPGDGLNANLRSRASQPRAVGSCNANADLAVVFNSPGDSFQVPARHPVPLQVLAVDCNGNAVTNNAAAVVVVQVPSLPDVEIPLTHQGSGLWTATWTPAMGASGVTLLARVNKSTGGVTAPSGMATLPGSVQGATADAASAVISVLNGARTDVAAEISAGAWATLKGIGFADAPSAAATAPYPKILAGTQVLMQNRPLPLSYVSPSQIDAFVPAGMNAGTQQLTVVRNGTPSTGVDVLVTQVGPGLFSLDGSGQGQGAIVATGTNSVAEPEQPVKHGQSISIYCTGLGPVNGDPPQDGEATPLSPVLATSATPKVTIGGMDAPVGFSGLVPALVGIYVVNVQVPDTVSAGDNVPVMLTIGGLSSNTVTIAVR